VPPCRRTLEIAGIDGLGGMHARTRLACGRCGGPGLHCWPVALPPGTHLGCGEAEVVGRRVDRLRAGHAHHDDLADDVRRAPRFGAGDHRVGPRAGVENSGHALEAVALAHERVAHVHLHAGVLSEVGARARRADVGGDEVHDVPDGRRALRRAVRGAVGADGGDEPRAWCLDDARQVGRDQAHGSPLFTAFGRAQRCSSFPLTSWGSSGQLCPPCLQYGFDMTSAQGVGRVPPHTVKTIAFPEHLVITLG
jgi:hypothetical protein